MKATKTQKANLAKDLQQENPQNNIKMVAHELPETGFVRDWQIVGSKAKGITPVLPISRTGWWEGVRSGRFPPGIKLSARTTVWPVESIRKLIAELGGQ